MKPSAEELAGTYGTSLYTIAFNICRNVQDAEDVVQDTLIAYMGQKRDFLSKEHVRAWLIRVAINKAKNKNRTFWRCNTVPWEEYMESADFSESEFPDLLDAVMKLPEKYRIVIHLFYYEDYSVQEIADILRLTTTNVKVRLTRGREKLRCTLKEEWNDDEP